MAKRNYDVTVQRVGSCKMEIKGIPFELTLAMTGMCTVAAESSEDAMKTVNKLPESELDGMIIWDDDGSEITDVNCLTDDDVTDMVDDVDLSSANINWCNIEATDADEEIDV